MRALDFVRCSAVLAAVAGMTACVGVTGKSAVGSSSDAAVLEADPTSISFGEVAEGTSASQAVSIVNNGTASATIKKIVAAGKGFSVKGISLPVSLTAGTSVSMIVVFTPSAGGAASGSVSIASSASSSPIVIGVKGTGATVTLSVTPASAKFSNVAVGTIASQTMELKASGATSVQITKVAISGAGFKISGLTVPVKVAPGKSVSFTATFQPASAGSDSGGISITSTAEGSPLKIGLSGTSVKAVAGLSLSPTSLSFSGQPVGKSKSQGITVKNTGNVDVTISKVAITGTGFSLTSGAGTNIKLTPSQQHTLTVTFDPTTTGNVSGAVTLASSVSSSPMKVPLSASTTSADVAQHTVALTWKASPSASVTGYYIYRSTKALGPYTKLNSAAETSTTYEDADVPGGATYYYVVTAVNAAHVESIDSKEVSINVPD